MMDSPGFLLCLTLLPLSVSSQSFFLGTVCTVSSRLELVEFSAVSLVNEVEVAQMNSSSGAMVLLPSVQKVTEQKRSLWKEHMRMIRASLYLLKETIQETSSSNHNDVQVLRELVGCEWDLSTGQNYGFLLVWLNEGKPLMFISNSETWLTPTPQLWNTDKFVDITEYWDYYVSTVCPELLRALVPHVNSTPVKTGGTISSFVISGDKMDVIFEEQNTKKNNTNLVPVIVAPVVIAVFILLLAAFIIYKTRNGKAPHTLSPENSL